MKRWIVMGLVILGVTSGVAGQAWAGDEACTNPDYPVCWPDVRVNQWACEACVPTDVWVCSGNLMECTNDRDICRVYEGGGICTQYCEGGTLPPGDYCKQLLDVTAPCNTSLYNCAWREETTACEYVDQKCTDAVVEDFKSCCGGGAGIPSPLPSTAPSTVPSICTPGTPTAPTLQTPANGSAVGVGVTLSWNAPSSWGHLDMPDCSYSDYYQVYVGTSSPPNTLLATLTATSIPNYATNPNTTYYWRVAANNSQNSTNSLIWSFTTPASLTGSVYLDTGNVCATSNPWNLGGLTASLRGTGYSASVDGSGSYAITAPTGLYSYLDLSGYPAEYICSTGCLQSCPTQTNVSVPSGGNNYYLTQKRAAWWQADGGGIYAGSNLAGQTIVSQLPLSTSRLILNGPAAALRASGSVDTGAGEISDNNISAMTSYTGVKTDYNYFVKRMGILSTQVNDWASDAITKPTTTKDYWYQDPEGSSAEINNAWIVTSGQSHVVFIKGDLEINQNVTVATGGFLIFIVDGSVTVDPDVTNIQGLYLMDGQFITTSRGVGIDDPLVVNGSVVTWTGVSLGRDLGTGNGSQPAEKFVYRADLLANMPDKLKGFLYNWQEVAPGTYGN